jgi:cytochrome c oxidase subunit 3
MPDDRTALAEQFETLEQQEHAATSGMWVFLATEALFFGGLFLAYTVFRMTYPHAFAMGSARTDGLLGALNTAILLTSSLSVAMAVQFAQLGKTKPITPLLLITIVLGIVFLALKGIEYREHILDHLWPGSRFDQKLSKPVELFFWLYFVMTGLHAVHVLIGIGIFSVMAYLSSQKRFTAEYSNPLKVSGLYWHFVDIVWVFLYPLFYLIHR